MPIKIEGGGAAGIDATTTDIRAKRPKPVPKPKPPPPPPEPVVIKPDPPKKKSSIVIVKPRPGKLSFHTELCLYLYIAIYYIALSFICLGITVKR